MRLICVMVVILVLAHPKVWTRADTEAGTSQPQDAEMASVTEEEEDETQTDCIETDDQSELNSFLWTLKREPPVYFFGTIHVPFTKVWKFIAENMKEAFLRADNVFFELDLTDPYTISALASCQLLPQGEYLSNVIPRPLYRRLKRHLEYVKLMLPNWLTADQRGQGLYADYLFNAITGNWERKRPVWVMMMVNSLTESDIRSRGVPVLDLYLAQEATRMEKQTGAVEHVEEQCVPLNELNFSQVVFALNHTLWQHENLRLGSSWDPYTTDDLIQHYNCGNLNSVIFNHDTAQVPNLVNSSLPPQELTVARQIDNYFRQELIYKRNQRMADRIEALLLQHPNESFFFAFGAGHFLGNSTVLDKLRLKGYEIEQTLPGENVYLGEHPPRRRRKHQRMMADMNGEFQVPPVLINGNIQYIDPYYDHRRLSRHRNRQHRRKGRRKDSRVSPTDSYRLKRPQFNDLWVRLESTSFGPDSYFRRQQILPTTTTTEQQPPVYAMYNNTASSGRTASGSPQLLLVLILVLFWSLNNTLHIPHHHHHHHHHHLCHHLHHHQHQEQQYQHYKNCLPPSVTKKPILVS